MTARRWEEEDARLKPRSSAQPTKPPGHSARSCRAHPWQSRPLPHFRGLCGGAARQRRGSAADALGKFGATAAPAITNLVKMLEESSDGKSMTASSDAEAATRALSLIATDASSSKTVLSAAQGIASVRVEIVTCRGGRSH